jgi:hypothetical protein
MELGKYQDGNLFLIHWDRLHGDDVVLQIDADGKAYRSTWEGDDEVLTPVDLVGELRALVGRWNEEEE